MSVEHHAYTDVGFPAFLLRMAVVSFLAFLVPAEGYCQSPITPPVQLSIQRLQGNGYWIAGESTLNPVSSIPGIRLAAVAGDSVLGFRGAGALQAPTTLCLLTNAAFAPARVYAFPTPFEEMRLLPTPFGHFVMMYVATNTSLPRTIWKGDQTLTNWSVVLDGFPISSNGVVPPSTTTLLQGWDYDRKGNVYLGEYTTDDTAYPNYQLHIFKGTNYGQNWSVAYTFPPRSVTGLDGGIRHVHACQVDPYTGDVWVTTGDTDAQSRIYYHTNALLPDPDGIVRLKLVGGGSQEYRTVSLGFTERYIYWFMDAPSQRQKMFRIRRATEYPLLTPQTPPEQDYRECIGVFPDKPFYYSRKVRSGADEIILVCSHYENAAHYGSSFREVDRWNRVFGIKEETNGTAQVQEVLAVLATGEFAWFDPLGQNSSGQIFFSSGNVDGEDLAIGYCGLLNWRDATPYLGSNYLGMLLTWASVSNGSYQLMGSRDMSSWNNVGLAFKGDGLTNSLYYSAEKQGNGKFRFR